MDKMDMNDEGKMAKSFSKLVEGQVKSITTENRIKNKEVVSTDEILINLKMDIQELFNKYELPVSIAYFVIKEIYDEVSVQYRQNQSEILMKRTNK